MTGTQTAHLQDCVSNLKTLVKLKLSLTKHFSNAFASVQASRLRSSLNQGKNYENQIFIFDRAASDGCIGWLCPIKTIG